MINLMSEPLINDVAIGEWNGGHDDGDRSPKQSIKSQL
jgi:hypothetical protein